MIPKVMQFMVLGKRALQECILICQEQRVVNRVLESISV